MATQTIDRTTDIPLVEPVVEKFQYPGIPTTCDGAEAVVQVETRISQGCRRVSDHQLDHDGRRLQPGRHERRAEPVGRPARVRRAGERALVGVVLRRLRRGRRARDQLHVRPGPRADEGGALHDRRQAAAGGVEHRRPAPDQPGAQRPRRARRRDERRRLRLGHAVRPQRPGGRRLVPDLPPRGRGLAARRSSTCRTASSRRTPSRACGCSSRSS